MKDIDMRPLFIFFGVLVSLFISACGSIKPVGRATVVTLPLNIAWMDGHKVEYITTDTSDPAMASALGVNLVPRLAQAISPAGKSVTERVYKFDDSAQISVFQSAPSPTGPENKDQSYSPLWRLALVGWTNPSMARELKSEEEILRAADANELSVRLTDIVINCPITRSVDGKAIKGAN